MVKVSRLVLAATLVSALSISVSQASQSSSTLKITLNAKVSKDFNYMSDLLKALKADGVICTKYLKSDGIIGVREEGTCSFNNHTLTLDLFSDDRSASITINAVKGLGSGYILGLKNWGVMVDDASTAKILQSGLKLKLY
jgi:hypothetical protein